MPGPGFLRIRRGGRQVQQQREDLAPEAGVRQQQVQEEEEVGEGVLLRHLVKPIEEGTQRRQSEVEEFYHHGDIEAGVGLELGDWKNR